MAMSVNPTNEKYLSIVMGQGDPAAMIRPRSTVPIRVSGQSRPQQKAGHMTASGQPTRHAKKILACRGPSTHDDLSFRCQLLFGQVTYPPVTSATDEANHAWMSTYSAWPCTRRRR